MRVDESHNSEMVIASICWILLMSLPQLCSQTPPPPLLLPGCVNQLYKCKNVSYIFHPFGENSTSNLSQCIKRQPFNLSFYDYPPGEFLPQNFTVEDINHTIKVVPTNPVVDVCSPQLLEIYGENLYPYSELNITIFHHCPSIPEIPLHNFTCGNGLYNYFGERYNEQYLIEVYKELKDCKDPPIRVPTATPLNEYDDGGGGQDLLKQVLKQGFEVSYDVPQDCTICYENERNCESPGLDERLISANYCPREPDACSHKRKWRWRTKLIVGSVSALVGAFTIGIITICCIIGKSSTKEKSWFTIKNDHDIEAFLKNHGGLAQRRYKFSEVTKMTNSFEVKLGEGGFGSVYKGEMLTGNTVAVKILNASKGNGEDFINEVASISRTCHVNVVTLLGFCFEGRKKALIYEFMPNGSLDKFIYNKGELDAASSLSWDNLWQIAVGIARGLEYLHRGCNTRILHFDIKPHNILLDENFCPKISDFGLAKLCHRKESIISMSDARGTIGYVAPEVLNRNFGGISYKSDVYSYGMMLLEMVGVKKNINAEASQTSEYFPDWIYKRLEHGGDLTIDGVIATVTEEKEMARRMTIVGLWCVQTFPNDRPNMSRVINMLEGNMNYLEMPPKPLLSSPARSVPEFTSSSLQSR